MSKKFDDVLQTLGNEDKPLAAEAIYSLSDLTDDDLARLRAIWGAIPVDRRRTLVHRLVEAAETNFDMDFAAVTRLVHQN